MCAPIKPGAYLRLRREAAGLSVADVAELIAPSRILVALNERLIPQIEAGEIRPHPSWVAKLSTVYRFDRHLFDLLASFDVLMRVCTVCGCSDLDRCDDEADGSCAWSAERPDTCTHCIRREAIAAPALPFLPA